MPLSLVAHFLDLRCLRFEDGTEGLNLFLLGCDGHVELLLLLHNGRLLPLINLGLFFHLTVFFEKLVEQRRVHRVTAQSRSRCYWSRFRRDYLRSRRRAPRCQPLLSVESYMRL